TVRLCFIFFIKQQYSLRLASFPLLCQKPKPHIKKFYLMPKTKIAGVGMYVPKNVVTNFDLMKYMDTSDEWIQERTGIKERRYADRYGETTATMGIEAAKMAIETAGLT